MLSSPRPWGCFQEKCKNFYIFAVFPTPVGVFLHTKPFSYPRHGLPHARGGVSIFQGLEKAKKVSSPRPWGCFYCKGIRSALSMVFPTPVGVFLRTGTTVYVFLSLPHARGGVSKKVMCEEKHQESSPRPWGCFYSEKVKAEREEVFPTPVGVFLRCSISSYLDRCLPHARGGVSHVSESEVLRLASSPRPWGCFSGGGKYQRRGGTLPHAHGGVSNPRKVYADVYISSPRPWGCFSARTARNQ